EGVNPRCAAAGRPPAPRRRLSPSHLPAISASPATIFPGQSMAEFAAQRLNMVESQLRTNTVIDPAVLRAMADLPRERFLPPNLRKIAYLDEDLPLGGGRFLMEPMVMARLIQ